MAKTRKKWIERRVTRSEVDAGLALESGSSYILKAHDGPLFEVWVRALDQHSRAPLAGSAYTLSGPLPDSRLTRQGTTGAQGDVRERGLECGEYRLEAASGRAVVAARCQEVVGADDGGRGTGSPTWPDVVRVDGAEATGDAAPEEPGETLPDTMHGVLWFEPDAGDLPEDEDVDLDGGPEDDEDEGDEDEPDAPPGGEA